MKGKNSLATAIGNYSHQKVNLVDNSSTNSDRYTYGGKAEVSPPSHCETP